MTAMTLAAWPAAVPGMAPMLDETIFLAILVLALLRWAP